MSFLKTVVVSVALGSASLSAATPTFAAEMHASHQIVQKSKSIKGSIQLVERDGARFVVFSEDFKAKRGPDLKVFLSPKSIDQATGGNAVAGSINLGALKSNKGTQEYALPEGVDLADFQSVLVQCEAYAVLWGGTSI